MSRAFAAVVDLDVIFVLVQVPNASLSSWSRHSQNILDNKYNFIFTSSSPSLSLTFRRHLPFLVNQPTFLQYSEICWNYRVAIIMMRPPNSGPYSWYFYYWSSCKIVSESRAAYGFVFVIQRIIFPFRNGPLIFAYLIVNSDTSWCI